MAEIKNVEWYKSLTPIQIKLYRQLYKKDFYSFFIEFWDTYESAALVTSPLLQFYCETYQYLTRDFINIKIYDGALDIPDPSDEINIIDVRQNKRNICINMPPSHTKSACLNVAAAVWTIINIPLEIASVSHTESLSTEMNKKRQRILNSEKFKFFFPEINLIENTASKLVTDTHANLYSINRNAFTGAHASIIIADDITNARTAIRDKVELQNAVDFYRDTLPSRLSDPLTGVIINIQQRLSNSDITANILSDEGLRSQYCFVILPAEFKKETYIVCPITGTVFHYNVGDFLYPERFGNYEGIKAQVGPSVWSTQYLQQPVSRTDSIIKDDMIREMDAVSVPGWDIDSNCIDETMVDRIYGSYDLPFGKSEKSDYVGYTLAYKIKKNIYIVDALEERQNFPDSIRFIKQNTLKYPSMIHIIEKKANGNAIIDTLREDIAGIIPFEPGLNSKEDRMSIASTWFLSGNIIFVRTKFDEVQKKWILSKNVQNLKQELLDFPAVIHDDVSDSLSQLIIHVFNDIKYSVYGKAFNDYNIVNTNNESYDYSTVFFNKDGDTWKVLKIGIKYGLISKLIILKEKSFVANINDGLNLLHDFSPTDNVFIDCSTSEGLIGIYSDTTIIERYVPDDFDKSVTDLNYAFAQNKILVDQSCKLTQADIENFKFDKKNTNGFKYATNKDGFVACLRSAMKYYGGLS